MKPIRALTVAIALVSVMMVLPSGALAKNASFPHGDRKKTNWTNIKVLKPEGCAAFPCKSKAESEKEKAVFTLPIEGPDIEMKCTLKTTWEFEESGATKVTEVTISGSEANCTETKALGLPWHGQGCHYEPATEQFDDWQNVRDMSIKTPAGTFSGSLFIHMRGTNNMATIASHIGATEAFLNGSIGFSPVVPGEYTKNACPETFFKEKVGEIEVEA
jgi:hypothetical protein